MTKEQRVLSILKRAKKLAKEYRALTGRPLGVTSEVAEYEAVRLLGLDLAQVRQPGYDAVRHAPKPCRLQIKGRCVRDGARSGRLGRIDLTKRWDAVLMVLLDEDLEAVAMYEAPRRKVVAALKKPGSRSRNERGALGVNQFKAIASEVWHRERVRPKRKRTRVANDG